MLDLLEKAQLEIPKDRCPYLYRDSPCASKVDECWAQSCPTDYKNCPSYLQNKRRGIKGREERS